MAERVYDIITKVQREIPNADMRDFFSILKEHMRLLSTVKGWRFFEKEYDFTLTASVPVANVTVTNGDATVTCAANTFTAGMVGRKFRVSGNHERVYEILTFTSATEIELDAAWQGDTGDGTASALVFVDEYAAPSDLRRERMLFNLSEQDEIDHVPLSVMIQSYYQYRAVTAVRPRIFTFKDFTATSGTDSRVVWFETAPEFADTIRLYYWRWPTYPTTPEGYLDLPSELTPVLEYDVILHYAHRPEFSAAIPGDTKAYWMAQRDKLYMEAVRNNVLLSRDVFVNRAPLFAPVRRPGYGYPIGRY